MLTDITDNVDAFSISPHMQAIFVVWLALALEKLIPISSIVNPLGFFRFVCQQMANKVRKQDYMPQQLFISGALALSVLVLPLLVIVFMLNAFASYQWLLDTLLLWVLIQYSQDTAQLNKGLHALRENKVLLAKNLLQEKLLRNTRDMSAMGLSKASLESVFLRFHHQLITTIACFLILGPIGALAYRLSYEAHQVWNIKRQEFSVFGRMAHTISIVCQFFPSVIMSISFIVISSPASAVHIFKQKQFWRSAKQNLTSLNHTGLLLHTLSSSLKVNTGGPAMYDTCKQQRPRFSLPQYVEPSIDTVKSLLSLLNRHLIVSLITVTWIVFWVFPA